MVIHGAVQQAIQVFIESLELPIDRAAELPSEGSPLNGLLNDPVIDSLSGTRSAQKASVGYQYCLAIPPW